ncbi:MAG: aryl-sulfate sulfotransferase, partial [Candidatus Omnitrophica bacterium]|nr:aryl-sulfate sulfotransferase [Candidatus Omnitrophota bacterium]
LIDMDGTLVHRWIMNQRENIIAWKSVTPFPDGSIFLNSDQTKLDWQKVDINSHPLATYDMPEQMAHHASFCLKEGGFLGLVQNIINVPVQNLSLKIEDNSLIQASSTGQIVKTIPLSRLLEKDPGYQEKLKKCYNKLKNLSKKPSRHNTKQPLFDMFHTNNIENLEWDIPGIAKKDNWLITVKHLDRIFIIDPKKEEVLWQWGDNIISRPHHATFLKGDQILLFDNGVRKKSSRVIVLDIRSKKIIWQYGQKPGQEFYTVQRGSAQRLPNGNTLIAEGNQGRVFEVTLSGEIVWEWYTDFYTKNERKEKRRIVYRMERLPYDFFKGITFNHGKIQP